MRKYRLKTATVGVDEDNVAIMTSAGSVVAVPVDFVNPDGFAEVVWNETKIRVFDVDLRERGELMSTRGA